MEFPYHLFSFDLMTTYCVLFMVLIFGAATLISSDSLISRVNWVDPCLYPVALFDAMQELLANSKQFFTI